jgi:transposase
LRNWIRAGRARGGSTIGLTRKNVTSITPAGEAEDELAARIRALEAELRAVRKENATLATERNILRKSTKFFASEMTW